MNGAIIDFGAIFDAIRVRINGHTLPLLDPTWARADISEYVDSGDNTVAAIVATLPLNTLRPLWSELMSAANGTITDIEDQPPLDYGLLSPVKVIPFKRTSGSVSAGGSITSSVPGSASSTTAMATATGDVSIVRPASTCWTVVVLSIVFLYRGA